MLTITFSQQGIPYSDFDAERFVLESYRNGESDIHTSTSNIVSAVRALIAEGHIRHDEVALVFKGVTLEMNEHASLLAHWPHDFCDHEERWLARIFHARKAAREGEAG